MSFVGSGAPAGQSGLLASFAGQAPRLLGLPIPPTTGPSNTVTDQNANAKLPKPATPAAGVPLPQLGTTTGPAKEKLGA